MKILKNEKGVALIMVLILSAITLAMIAGLLYFVITGTKISGMEKRYKTALEASTGGADISYDLIETRGTPLDLNTFIGDINALSPVVTTTLPTSTCQPVAAGVVAACDALEEYDPNPPPYTGLETKLKLPTICWSGCDSSVSIDPGPPGTYDMRFQLGTAPAPLYNVYVKIVDATYGNSGANPNLVKNNVIKTGSGEIVPVQILYLYTIEVLSQNSVNPLERAKTSVLYGY